MRAHTHTYILLLLAVVVRGVSFSTWCPNLCDIVPSGRGLDFNYIIMPNVFDIKSQS